MDKLKQQLTRDLLIDLDVRIVENGEFSVPVQTIELQYTPIARVPMDVLMKMTLFVIKKMPIQQPKQISELLHVEILFITDVLQALTQAYMIEHDVHYHLTAKGEQQLALGIFEQQLATHHTTLIYSMLHQQFSTASLEEIENNEYFPPPLEDTNEEVKLSEDIYCQQLTAPDALVTSIERVALQQVYDVPCLYFVLYNKEQDSYYARVWHVLEAKWDEILEAKLNEQRLQWRKKYAEKEALINE